MKNKRLALKQGFLVRNREIIECHVLRCSIKKEYYEESEGFLVITGGQFQLIKDYKKEVFDTRKAADTVLREKEIKHVEFCKNQIEYYEKSIAEAHEATP